MKNLKVALAVACAVVVGCAFTAAADIPASAYVQDGLVGHWDGIENAGAGRHDNAATTWADLAGGIGDATRKSDKIVWQDNCWTNGVNGTPFEVDSDFAKALATKCFTLELHVRPTRTSDRETFIGNYSAGQNFNLEHNGTSPTGCFRFYCNNAPSWGSPAVVAAGEAVSASFVASADGYPEAYTNGVLAGRCSKKITASMTGDHGTIFGGEYYRGSMAFRGSFYSVRLYSRALTADEIAINANLDMIRYDGVNPASLVWPNGYRWNSGSQKIECRFSVDETSGGSVTVDDVDVGERYESWFVHGTERRATLQATPATGWRFAGWTGDVEGLSAAERVSPTVTVTTGKPMALTAVFCFDLSASACVQKGLVAHWDAVENAGAGTHDPAATTWVDLSGNGHDAALPETGVSVEALCMKFTNARAEATGCAFAELTTPLTLGGSCRVLATTSESSMGIVSVQNRAVLSIDARSGANPPTEGCYCFGTPNSSNFGSHKMNHFWARNESYKVRNKVRRTVAAVCAVTSSTSAYPKDAPVPLYEDGVQQTSYQASGWASATTAKPTGSVFIGGTTTTFEFNAVRLYDRQLSAEEIAINALTDQVRFDGADPAELTWPEGYRFNAEAKCVETTLKLAYDTTQGSVGVDGAVVEPSEGWFGISVRHELTATPAEGYRFSRWNGDVDPAFATNATVSVWVGRGASISAVFDRVGKLNARSYVQTGLIAQWDAIENAGTGTHDAAATNWVDLVGNGGDLLLPEDAFEIGERQLTLVKNRATGAVATLATRGLFTGEAYCSATSDYSASDTTRSIFYNPQIGLYFRNTSGLLGGLQRKTDGKSYYYLAQKPRATADIRQPHTYSTYATQTNMILAVDGLEEGVRSSSFYTASTTLTNALSVGNTYVTMVYGSVRLYNRPLTAEETAHNAVVDRIRFLGAEQAEAGGWRVNAETQELEVRVSAVADGGGTVGVDDEGVVATQGATAEKWFELGQEGKVVVTATPAEGYRFVSWTGDNSLTAAQKTSATLTLPALAARNLTAVFLGDDDPHWTYAVGAGTLTLGDTAFTVTASTSRDDGINISTLTSLAEDGVVNLRLPIVGDDGALYVLTSIGTVFKGSTVLTELYIPDSVTSIGGEALKGASSLGYVYLPAYLETLGSSVFQDCTSLTNLTNFLAPTVRSIGGHCFNGSKISQTLYLSNPDWTATTTYSAIYAKYLTACDMTGSGIKSFNGGWEFFGDSALREVILSDKFETFPNVNPIFGSCGSLRTFKFRGGPPTIIVTDPINGMKSGFTWFAPKWDKRWEAYLAAQEECTVSTPTSTDCSNFLAVHPNEPIPTMKVSISKISNHLFSWWYPNPPPECEEVSLVDLLGYDGVKPDFFDGDANLLDGTTWTANTAHWTNGWYSTAGFETTITLPAAAKTARAMKMKRYRLHQLCMGDKTYFKYANARAPTEWKLYGKRTNDSDWTLIDERTLTAESDVAWAYLKNPTTYPVTGVAQTVPPRAQCSITFDLPEEKQNCYCVFKFVPTKSYNVEHAVTADTTPIALMELEILGELPSSAPHVTACTVLRQGWTDLDFSVTIDSKGEQPALGRYAAKAYARVEIAEDATFSTLVSSSAQTEIDLGESVVTVPGLAGRTGYFARVILDNDLGFAVTNVLETATLQSPFELDDPVVGATDDGKLTVSLEFLNLYAAPATAELWYAAEPGGEYRKLAEKQVDAAGVVALATAADGFPADAVGQVRITVTADGVSESRDKTPYGLWIVDRKALTMTHSRSGAAFNVTVAEDNVTLTSALDLGEETAFDLTAAVFDTKGGAMTLVSVGTAFKTNLTLKEVLLPDSVKTLSANAFDSCTKLVKVRLPNALESLGSNAFNGCGQLEDISPCLPPTCTSIGSSAFNNCKMLPRIDIPEGIKSIPDSFLNNCAKIREVRIPDSCTTIGTSAFSGCALTNVLPRVLPPQIKSVGVSAMRGFSVKIPELILDNPALTQLGSAAFYGQSFGLVDLSKSSFIGFKNGWEFDAGTIDEFILPPCCTNLYNPGNGVFGTVRKLRFTGNPPMVGTGTNVLDSTITTYYVPFHNGAWNRYLADHPDWVQPMTAADQKAWKDMMKKYFPNDPLIPRPKQKLKLNGIGDFRYLIRYGGGLMVILR